MPADNPIIQINGLRKTYKNAKLPALNGLDLSIIKGEVFGLLGPNGAGKTTTISILCGLMNFDHGEIRVQTKDLQKNLSEIKKLIGVAPQEIAL
ncbi:MAG: ATP-binding cassette domain-containing protein, partial [Calditrichaceae bacterium]|nr:ATP-binding cassette domain-containing protein [Calditrichaceae bacterium]